MAVTSIDIIPATIPITVVQGNSIPFTTTISVNSVAVDLTVSGNVVAFIVEDESGTNLLSLSSSGVSPQITLQADGDAIVSITAAQTAALSVGGYFYSLTWTRPTAEVRTLHSGSFTVIKSV